MRKPWTLIRIASITAALTASSSAVSQLGRAADPRQALPPDSPTGLSAAARQLLALHNAERSAFGVPPLEWNPALEAAATAYAQQLAQLGTLAHAPREGRGTQRENLSQGLPGWSPAQLMSSWLAERRNLKPGAYPDVSATGRWEDVSHETQIIWPTTTEVGCGSAQGRGFSWLVCRYDPGGNKDGKQVGTLQAAADAHRLWNSQHLKGGGGPAVALADSPTSSRPPDEVPHAPDRPVTVPGQCTYHGTGAIQPVQGVYQDDTQFPFIPEHYNAKSEPTLSRNPQLEEIQPGLLHAKLPMITGRDTVIMGAERVRVKGSVELVGRHRTIVISGVSNCQKVISVRMRFRLQDTSGTRTLWESPVITAIPIEGPKLDHDVYFQVSLLASDGVPPDETFKISGTEPYMITVDLVRMDNNLPLQLRGSVVGSTVRPEPPVVKFVPLILSNSPVDAAELRSYRAWVEDLRQASRKFIPDYYPLPPDGLPTFMGETLNLASLDPGLPEWAHGAHSELADWSRAWHFQAAVVARLQKAAELGGADRVVAVLRAKTPAGSDYDSIETSSSSGVTGSTKVVFVRAEPGEPDHDVSGLPAYEPTMLQLSRGIGKVSSDIVDTVAHELAHTLPNQLWSGVVDNRHSMMKTCERDYHGTEVHNAYGERLVIGGYASERRNQDGLREIMGSGTQTQQVWISQCTYAHLIASMYIKPDPPLSLISLYASRFEGKPAAEFNPGYDLSGIANVEPGPISDWGLEVRDSAARLIQSYPFDPHWFTEENENRNMVAVILRVPASSSAREFRVVNHGQVLAQQRVSAEAPSLVVNSPSLTAAGTANVSWSARTVDGRPLLASVLYSDSGGRWFDEQVFEQPVTSAQVRLNPQVRNHMVKVVVTDGARSSEQVVHFNTGGGS